MDILYQFLPYGGSIITILGGWFALSEYRKSKNIVNLTHLESALDRATYINDYTPTVVIEVIASVIGDHCSKYLANYKHADENSETVKSIYSMCAERPVPSNLKHEVRTKLHPIVAELREKIRRI